MLPRGFDLPLLAGAVQAEKARRSLYEFVRQYWRVARPGAEFVDNWHIEAICEHLQAVSEGQIRRLVINVPFRTAKSTITSVLWPAWTWAREPEHQWLCGSYAEKLAIRDSLGMRRLVQSPQFVAAYGHKFAITSDQNQKVRFQNDKGGYRIAFGMTGGVMGDGGDTLLIDDPHDRQGAHSEAERETSLTTYDEALITRLNDPATSPIVIIMQRLHHRDLTGHVLAGPDKWTHLMIPMEWEAQRSCVTSIGWRDPRKTEGELMFPARFPRATVDSLKQTLGAYGTAGQLQQRPSPEGGGVLDVRCFKLWPNGVPWPDFRYIVQSYDTAYTDKTANDPTACSVWGVFDRKTPDAKIKPAAMLLDCWSEFMQYPQLRQKMLDDWMAKYGGIDGNVSHPPRRADSVLIEEKGSGQSLIQDLRQANVPVIAYNPGRADKTARAQVAAPLLEASMFYIPESGRTEDAGKARVWARPMLAQLEHFPNGEHDDYVDTFTQMAIFLRDKGFLELKAIDNEEPIDVDYHERSKARVNPYAQ